MKLKLSPERMARNVLPMSGGRRIEGTLVPQSRKVLIVEDEEILAENLQAHFQRGGWDARIAGTGKSAVIAAGEFRPGMILLDYHLPDMDGFDALEAIRAVHCCSCVLMTAHPADRVLAEAERHGVARILSKPFSMAGLQAQLWETAAEFCGKCFENGRRPGQPNCGGFAPPNGPSVLGNFPRPS
jgi:CheY-like chemotaxis protein